MDNSKYPLVSIITIVFNGEAFLEGTINSVLDQTYKNLEYIIVDGGSTDGSVEIIRKYQNRLTNWISEKDNGISDAFNKGISMAKGDLIALINSDDWYEKEAVEKAVLSYEGINTIICGNVKLFNSPKKYNVKRSSLVNIQKQMTIWHPGMFVPSEVYEKVGFYDTKVRILMDYDFVIRCVKNGVRFKFIDEEIANMRYGGLSNRLISHSMKESKVIKDKYFGQKMIHIFEYYYYLIYYKTVIFAKKIIY